MKLRKWLKLFFTLQDRKLSLVLCPVGNDYYAAAKTSLNFAPVCRWRANAYKLMQESDPTLGSDPTGSFRGEASTTESSSIPEVLTLPADTILTGRYKIIETLGIGGMGVVYKVFDLELTRTVALSTILPELAATPAALQRFKQEVLLAQKVIHKNVVRIFDIGDHGGTKFITLDFIDGVDLKNLILQRGKLPPQEAAAIIRQASEGLEAAHAAGVVHRDLKPQNIMVQKDGQVLVTDFGIARSNQSRGVTQTGAFLGTPEYMSPEQAQGEEVGAHSDIFSMGLIFYEMLTGKLPFHANTMLETMFIRTRERAIPPNEIDQSVPKGANDIVVKCLEIDRDRRYQSVTELLNDLETFDTSKKVAPVIRAKSRLRNVLRYWNWAAGLVLVLLVALAAFMFRNWLTPKPVTMHTPVTVLVADFDNPTGDPLFSGSLETTCETALEEAPFINKYNRSQARTVLGRIQKGATKLDEAAARLVAIREGISVVVAGSIARKGAGYQISVRAIDPVPGSVV